MSPTTTSPQAGDTAWAYRSAPNVTVAVAVMCAPIGTPVSGLMPLGTSMARIGVPAHLASNAARSSDSPFEPPNPMMPSITRS